jgi:hypothetical protein
MIDSGRLKKTLSFLDRNFLEHQTAEDPEEAVAFAKLAVLEFCGWVEMTIDDIAREAVRGSLPTEGDRRHLETLIKNISGFDYEQHVAPIFVASVGSVKFSAIEQTMMKDGILDRFKLILNSRDFKTMRNRAAHTFNDGVQRNFDAPSTVLGKLREIEPILDRIRQLCCLDE